MSESTTPKEREYSKKEMRRLVKTCGHLLDETDRLRRKHVTKLKDEEAKQLEASFNLLQSLVNQKERTRGLGAQMEEAGEALDQLLSELLGFARKSAIREYIESIVFAVLIALTIRTGLVEPFKIPTGSMIPTLEINDHIFVNKFLYGVRIPFSDGIRLPAVRSIERGDVIVFENPENGADQGKDFIKRVVAIAGDRIRLTDNQLIVNETPVETEIRGLEPCADLSKRTCGVQQESLASLSYFTQHSSPIWYRVKAGDTLTSVAEKMKNTAKGIFQLNRKVLLDAGIEEFIDGKTALKEGSRLRLSEPLRWGQGTTGNWPLPAPACPLPTSNQPCFGAQTTGNPAFPDVEVPDGFVLTFGDNRDNSRDGRFWGFVPIENVKGKAFIIWWATNKSRIFSPVL